MLEKDAVLARIAELVQERDRMITDAQARAMAYSTAIDELEKVAGIKVLPVEEDIGGD